MAQQRDGKTRRARRIGKQGLGILRARAPARDGGAGRRARHFADADAQQKKRDAGRFRRPRQAQGRGEIERARRAENFDQGDAETLAARGVHARAQDGFGVASAHQGQSRGIDAELHQSDAVQPPGLAFKKILPRPQHRPP